MHVFCSVAVDVVMRSNAGDYNIVLFVLANFDFVPVNSCDRTEGCTCGASKRMRWRCGRLAAAVAASSPNSDNADESVGRRVAAAMAPRGGGGVLYSYVNYIKCLLKCPYKRTCNTRIRSVRRIFLNRLTITTQTDYISQRRLRHCSHVMPGFGQCVAKPTLSATVG